MYMGLTTAQLTSLGRDGLKLVGMFLAFRGYTDEGSWQLISGAIMTLAGVAGSMYVNTRNATITRTAGMPGVKGVVTTAELANAIPARNVVSDSSNVPTKANE